MKLTIVVAGLFHYRHYLSFLTERNKLEAFYFSYKLKGLSGLVGRIKHNFFLKEYLMYLHIKLLGSDSAFRWMHVYNNIWEFSCWLFFRPGKINLFLLQGSSLVALRRAKATGALVVGEAVNIHPKKMKEIMLADSKIHGVEFFWSARMYERKLSEIALLDYLIAPSHTVAESFIAEGFPSNRIAVLQYGCPQTDLSFDGAVTARKNTATSKIKVLCVAQLFPRKGQLHFLLALKEYEFVEQLDITFVGIANREYLAAMNRTDIKFNHLSHVDHSDVLKLMASADIVLLNSLEDGFGMVVTEALAVGTAVIVSKYAGASELVRDVGGGLIVDPMDYKSIATALNRCIESDYPKLSGELPTWSSYAQKLISTVSMIEKKQ